MWSPASLYYLKGQSPARTARVAIFAQNDSPPQLPNGHLEHINLGWDARLDPDGRHEDLTLGQGALWMQVLDGHPQAVRTSIRQLDAMTQGILRTSHQHSAIAEGSNIDHFTPGDIAAMKLMSGCAHS